MTLLPTEAPESAPSTRTALERPAPSGRIGWSSGWQDHLPTALVVTAVAWWMLVAVRNWGGRGSHAVSIGAGLTLLALLSSRPQRYLGRTPLWLAATMSVGGFVVAGTAESGWQGASVAAPYACAAWLTVAVAAEVRRREETVSLLTMLIVVATLAEFYGGWTAWHGGLDPRIPFSGTFYWYNQLAAFMIPGTIIGFAYWLSRRGPIALLGLLGSILGSIAIFYSTSRASLACAILGLAVVVVLHLRLAPSVRLSIRALWGGSIATAAVFLVAGPPFFPHRYSPVAGTAARATGQSLGQNGGYRLDFWREALTVFAHHPVVGSGFRALAAVAGPLVPVGWPKSPLAHNGYLQALSDGGLVLGLPVCVGSGLIVWLVLRQLAHSIRGSELSPMTFAVPLALGALLAHSFVDFDWSYPSLFALSAVLAGLVLGRRSSAPVDRASGSPATHRSWITTSLVAVGVVTLALSTYTARTGEIHLSVVLHGAHSGHGGTR